MKMKPKTGWKRLPKEIASEYRIHTWWNPLKIAERELNSLQSLQEKYKGDWPGCVFIIGRYLYIVDRAILSDEDVFKDIWTCLIFRVPAKEVKVLILSRKKGNC